MVHIHATLMFQYAAAASRSDTPWQEFEFQRKDGEWQNLQKTPKWHSGTNYRSKSGAFSGTLEQDQPYWMISYNKHNYEVCAYWNTTPETGRRHVETHLIYLTKEAADAQAKHLNAITGRSLQNT